MADVFDMIVAGDIPAYKVYEDDDVLAFLDLSQVTPGHTLVVPKTHVADIFEYDEALAARVLSKLPKIARAIKASDENIIGLNILSNNGEAAGQSVFHSHFHLIPRYANDGFDIPMPDHSEQTTEDTYKALAANIASHMED
ncbi:diadenosine tetraphosphate hydrolase [Weissella confusa]|uniref:HIT family protein n=1 Tax=Weissella confusa TaxID=1583 RepID=UPI0008FE80FA|nr:HIT family protein [Weissella confusa]OJF03680.1 diadenosine tetraphosphate hydrolase [Weissella confusa]